MNAFFYMNLLQVRVIEIIPSFIYHLVDEASK